MNTILNACAPVINAAATNCCDVEIVKIICITVGIVVFIIAAATCIWHCQSVSNAIKMKEQEIEYEKEKRKSEKE